MKYKTIHSLGSRCQNSDILKHYNYREFSGFFDFMNTINVKNINHMLADDFNSLLDSENNVSLQCNQLTYDPESGVALPISTRTSNKIYNKDYYNIHTAIFPHHDLNTDKDMNHFLQCKKRFKKLINYNTLFNYSYNTWENSVTTTDMDEMVNSLKIVHNFKKFKVCFIGISVGNSSSFRKISSSEYYDSWELIINNSFTGGLFSETKDNENYIKIIESYDIDKDRISKNEIDMEKNNYNSWPLGKVPKELQRPELDKIKELGYDWSDPREVINMFEEKVAKFAGSKYAVAVDCCSNGLFLSLKYQLKTNEILSDWNITPKITIPKMTYISAPMQIKHAGCMVEYEDLEWSGVYQLKGSNVWDGAVRWTKDMYVGNDALQVVSFQIKKRIPIGKGGIILTDDINAYNWLKLVSYDGRDLTTPYTDTNHIKMIGYHMYMTPEDAARGIILMDSVPEVNEDTGNHTTYTDISKYVY